MREALPPTARPRAMEHLGWIEKSGKVEPLAAHNHMPSVTLWRSLIYDATR